MSVGYSTTSDQTKHLSNEELSRYKQRVDLLGTIDPYEAPGALFTSVTAASVHPPTLECGDIMVYLVENPSSGGSRVKILGGGLGG